MQPSSDAPEIPECSCRDVQLHLELELILSHMTQKPVLRVRVFARVPNDHTYPTGGLR